MSTSSVRVLVAVASKYGATAEIAAAIRGELSEAGLQADLLEINAASSIQGYDAAVIGSAVYMGRWLTPAREFVDRHAVGLSSMPVWLFSSGPIGDPPRPEEDPVDAAPLVEQTAAREHRVFAGRLERNRLSFAEKAVVIALRAPQGDFRDWDAIRSWARGIAESLGCRVSE